jgi:hypothetical protein
VTTPEMMQAVFGVPPVDAPVPAPVELTPPPPAPKPAKAGRTVGDVSVMAEAQRIYNPQIPPQPPKAPSAAMVKQGTSSAMDTSGAWGKPEGR